MIEPWKFQQICRDPLAFKELCWPDVRFYRKQIEIIRSVDHNDETVVTAGNMLGKDFVSGFIALWYFVAFNPVKIITTSATDRHLDTLWGEIDRFIRTSRIPLKYENGGMMIYNHRNIVKVVNGLANKEVYMKGMVASNENKGEGMSGHHSLYSLFICDEASGTPDVAYTMAQGWMKKSLIIGNPFPCHNFFKRAVEGGDLIAV